MAEIAYFGTAGIQAGAELSTDKNGLVTGNVTFKGKPGDWGRFPKLGSAHPHAGFCTMEKRTVRMTAGYWEVTGSYAGMEPGSPDDPDNSDPQYDFNPGVGNEPIETHKDFLAVIGGSASAPANGAFFVDGHGNKTDDDSQGRFSHFSLTLLPGGARNDFAGISEYLTANNSVWTKSWTSKTKPTGGTALTRVTKPPGDPDTPAGHDWLRFPVACSQRGKVWECKQQWMLSGPRGWNAVIYP